MRGTVEGLASPRPLIDTLPSMLRGDPFAQQLCASLDTVVAPIFLSLDTFPSILDLDTAPEDMLPWLAQWVGMTIDPAQEVDAQRSMLRSSGELHATRGTRRGMQLALEAALGASVEVVESGAAAFSVTPGGTLPGEPNPGVVVIVRLAVGQEVDVDKVESLVRSLKPAHIPHRVQIVTP